MKGTAKGCDVTDAIHDARVEEFSRTGGTRPDEAGEQPDVTERRAFVASFEAPDSIEWRYWVEQMPMLSAPHAARLMSALEPDGHRSLDASPNDNGVNALRLKALKIERLAAAHGREHDSPSGWLRWARGLGLKVHDGFVLAVEGLKETAPPAVAVEEPAGPSDETLELQRREEEARAQAEALRRQQEELADQQRQREEAERAAREAAEKAAAQAEAAAAAQAEAAPRPAADWVAEARTVARAIIERQRALDLYPPQRRIADEVAADLRKRGIFGPDGKPLAGGTIKRHALRGITSAPMAAPAKRGNRGK